MPKLSPFALATVVVLAGSTAAAQVPGEICASCHTEPAAGQTAGLHAGLACATCHEGAAVHQGSPADPALHPRVHFDQEICKGCHADQYDTFEVVAAGRTFYGGSDPGSAALPAPKGWSKTLDLPYWNVLIDGHPFVLETYEDRPMAVNQIEHQETIRPGSEACVECHGTRAAFAMGIQFVDKNGAVRSVPAQTTQVTLPSGATLAIPAKEYAIKYRDHLIYDGTSHQDPLTGEWKEVVNATTIPLGTRVWTYTDGVNLAGGSYPQPYQVKTLVTLPAAVTADVLDKYGAVVGQVTFRTIASFPEAGADINGMTGLGAPAPPDANVATVARNWIYAALEALNFDGLDYAFADPLGRTTFTASGANASSIVSGELCNQCHDPHAATLRIVKKALIAAIGARGVNPYSATGANVLEFSRATRQDQIIAVCAQCHSEYVGGYSANTKLDQDYFPWAKPADLESLYTSLFGYLQDWTHGGPIAPWQSADSNARGFLPYGARFPIGAPLVKVQHPEAETFFGSPMYNVGATCTDCHSVRVTRPDGTRYTSHWFTSPVKIMDGFAGVNEAGQLVTALPQNPCTRCHTTDTVAQSKQRIKDVQDQFFFVQERTQVALVNALRFIAEKKAAGLDASAEIAAYQRAAMRWEYYTQAENSMGFHNRPEATTEVSNARLWVDAFVHWPLTPVRLRVTGVGADAVTIAFYDQADDETSFLVERAPLLEGPYVPVAEIPTPNGAMLGDVPFTDTGLSPATPYFYRVSARSAAGASVPSVWASATTLAAPLPPAAPANLVATATGPGTIDLAWTDASADETGFRIERARDAAFTIGLVVFQVGANVTGLSDSGLAPATTCYYRAFAVGAAGLSSPSNTASATTADAPPAAPSGLVITAVRMGAVSLAWKDNSTDETGFTVERSVDGVTFAALASVPANATAFTDGTVLRRRTYWYRAAATKGALASQPSNVVVAKTK